VANNQETNYRDPLDTILTHCNEAKNRSWPDGTILELSLLLSASPLFTHLEPFLWKLMRNLN